VLPPLAGLHGDSYRDPDVMVHGFRVVTVICAVLLAIAAVVVAFTVRIPSRALHEEG
jgi:hypothetical protein